ncbi:MAG TPA: ATP-binding protein [Polyangiales bacterium]|nr:ATP-binding protein [Polyangiales bacterium]
MWIGWGPEATFLYNDAYIPVLSLAKHPWALGRPAAEVWAEIWDVCGPLAEKVFRQAEPTFVEDVRLFMNRGDYVEETYYSFSYSPIRDESGGIGGLFCPSAETTSRILNARRLKTLSALTAGALVQSTIESACASAVETLAENKDDVPVALLYLASDDGAQLHLQSAYGATDETLVPKTVVIEAGHPVWPFTHVARSAQAVVVATSHLDSLPLGLADQRVREAISLPVLSSHGQQAPMGVLVMGVNPARKLDPEYRTFYDLVAAQIARAIHNARTVETETRRADMLAALDRAKTDFFSNVSHEFRTPLTLMLGPMDEALAAPGGALQGESLETVQRNAARLLKLVNTLLDFSRMEAGRIRARFEPVDLSVLTADLASAFRSAMERGGLRFDVDCPPLPEPVYVDHDMWEKIVLNLLSNALKFTFEGAVRVALRSVDDRVELTVSDTGAGIPEHELPRLFERFHRIEETRSRTHEGSGIGLALVRDLVALHGGDIRATSRVGEGTTFTVTLPTGFAHLPEDRVDTKQASPKASFSVASAYVKEALRWLPDTEDSAHAEVHTPPGAAHVLLADDNSDMRTYVSRLLRPHWDVEVAADGAEALAAARRRRPDLVVTDVMMPNLDGFGLLRELRADPSLRAVPVIMLSARAGEEARVEGVEAGADDYLVKPFSARELVARVGSLLQLAELRSVLDKERTLRALAQAAANLGVYEWDLRSDKIHWSPELYELLGLIPGEVEPSVDAWTSRIVEEDRDEAWAAFNATIAKRLPRFEVELRLRTKNGVVRHLRLYQAISYDPKGEPVRLVGAALDIQPIVERRDLEQTRLRERLAVADEERRRLLSLLGSAPAIMNYMRGPELVMEFVHPLAMKFYRGRDPRNRPLLEAFPELRDQPFAARLRRVLETGETLHHERELARFEIEGQIEKSYWTSTYLPVRDGAGNIDGVLTFDLDVTAVVRADEEREALLAAAEEANRAKDDFIAMLGHELRNPLAPILTATQLLRLRGSDAMLREVNVIERQAQHLVRLVDDLLDVSRITSRKVTLAKESVEVAEVVALAIETASPIIESARHTLVAEVPKDGMVVEVDRVRMAQVIANLLTNAAKYTPPGGRIRVATTLDGDDIVIAVEDNGAGISAELLPKVFDLFVQARQTLARSQGGLGLGLTIVRSLVTMHGGSVTAESDGLAKGSRFTIRLPVSKVRARVSTVPSAPKRVESRRERVLVVDDNADAAEMLCAALEALGYRTAVANDGPQALRVLDDMKPDVALLDIGLPVMDGYELAQRMQVQQPGIDLFAISGYGQDSDLKRSREVGFRQHLTKPVDLEALARLLEGRRSERGTHDGTHTRA